MRTNRWILAACAALPFAVAATAAADDANRATTLGYRGVIVGGSVHQTEPVSGDLSAAGGQLTIDAPVARNLRAAGGHVEIGSNAAIGGNVSVAGGKVEIHAPVKGDVRVAGGQVLIDSSIDGNVEAAAGKLELGPNARIGGKLSYRSGNELERDPAAQVAGGVERLAGRGAHHAANPFARGWIWTLGIVVLAVILAGAVPSAGQRVGAEMRSHPWIALLAGLVALVCIPTAAVLLMITIVGIPLGVLAILLYGALLMVGYVLTAVTLGDLALARARPADTARTGWRMGAAALAVLVLALLTRVPFVGGFVLLVAIVAGIGALFLAIKPPAREAAAAA